MLNLQRHDPRIHQHFTGVLEVNGDAPVDDRLHLAEPPIRTLRMADKLPGFEEKREGRHGFSILLRH